MAFDRDKLKAALADHAAQGVFIGTSSWKYAGWRGTLYDESRYVYHGKLSEARFEKFCLTEFARVFKTVCVDAAYYKFPDGAFLESLVSQVPADFQFALKVTDQITIKRFPSQPRFGRRAGVANQDFLNADRFQSAFLGPCLPFQRNIGVLILEFSHFSPADFARGRHFMEALDHFLEQLPKGWRYAVEMRNRNFLHPDYFAMLGRHGVAHVFNSWQDMPSVGEQIALPGSFTTPDFFAARLLLRPGRNFEQAVKLFSPYDRLKDPYPEGRAAGAALIRKARGQAATAKAFIFTGNRFEGNSLESIAAMIEQAG